MSANTLNRRLQSNIDYNDEHKHLSHQYYLDYNRKTKMWEVIEQINGGIIVISSSKFMYEATRMLREELLGC